MVYIFSMPKNTDNHFEKPLCFVDIETTGGMAQRDRIIEIGVVRVESGKVVKTWEQLINPGQWLPDFIVGLTNITPQMLEHQPRFADIADELLELLDGSLFVAHNARFDYTFLKAEFRRLNISVSWPHMCSVRLSRSLFPDHRSHSLDSLIERHNLVCSARHRALSDAEVIWQFFSLAAQHHGWEKVKSAAQELTRNVALPPQLNKQTISDLPQCPGVYIFYGEQGEPLYIGKSKQIRSRVQAHFYSDLRSDTELLIKDLVYSIEARTTAGELSALLLESELIKTLQPLFNRSLRRHEPAIEMLLTFNANNYYHIKSESKHVFDPEKGDMRLVFKTKKIAQCTLTKVADEHQLCYKLLGLETGSEACMRFHLGECRGACANKELAARYNLRVIEALRNVAIKPWPYSGPVVFKEYNVVTGQEAAHCIDQWIYLGDAQHEDETIHSLPQHQDFDLDAYVILKRFLLKYPDNVQLLSTPSTKSLVNQLELTLY